MDRHARHSPLCALVLLLGAGCADARSHEADAALPADAEVMLDGALRDGGSQADGDAGTDARTGFAPFAGLSGPAQARSIGGEYVTSAKRLVSAPDGSSWLYWRSYSDPTFTRFSDHLEHFDAQGRLLESSPLESLAPDGFALDAAGAPVAYRSRCGALQRDVCFTRAEAGRPLSDLVWPRSPA